MTEKKMNQILKELKDFRVDNIDDYIPFPKPFCGNGVIKAILLGMDPSTNHNIRFDTVFNLNGNDKRYFNSIEKNLDAIGLPLNNLYVQNFCQNYFTKTTYEQKRNWYHASGLWWRFLKEELDEKFTQEVPLLITSELLFDRLTYITDNKKFSTCYENPETIPVESAPAISRRMLIPFSRHWKYNLNRPECQPYREKLKKLFQ
jgi:hypothetical protein